MDSQYFDNSNPLDSLEKMIAEKNISREDAYEYMRVTEGMEGCSIQTTRAFNRQKEIREVPSHNTTKNIFTNIIHDRGRNYSDDIEKFTFNDQVTDINNLDAPLARKIHKQKQFQTSNERGKKRIFKHFGSAKTASRKSRSVTAPRRVASGPVTMGRSSSSSDESTEYETSRLISAPEPAPPGGGVSRRVKPPNINIINNQSISPSFSYVNSDATNLSKNTNLDTSPSVPRTTRSSVPRPLNIPITSVSITGDITPTKSSSFFTGNPKSPCLSPNAPRSPRSPRSPVTRQRSPRIQPRNHLEIASSPRYQTTPQQSPLPTIPHSPNQSSRESASPNCDRNSRDLSNKTLRSPRSPGPIINYEDLPSHSAHLYNTTNNPSACPSGHLAMLASRRRSAAAHCGVHIHRGRRPSNFLELPGTVW